MITLKNNVLAISVHPEKGASLLDFRYNGQDVLRPANKEIATPEQAALFLMMPYCSYIKEGRFNYFGINRLVPKNNSAHPYPIHGDACQAKWEVKAQTENSLTLTYAHKKENGFPFDYQAQVTYALLDNRLQITLSLTNPAELPMPCGFGVHPYFIHPKTAEITFASSHIWHHKSDPIFDRPYPTPAQWDFSKNHLIQDDFDTAFGGWDGMAEVVYPEEHMRIKMSAEDIFHHLILYHPQNADFFCLEPCSNTPDAFNLAAYGVIGTGIQSIGANQTISKTITFECEKI